MARIAAEADVSIQTVYNSIGTKSAILRALQDLIDDAGNVAAIQDAIARSDDPREVVALAARLRRLLMEGAGDIVKFTAAAASADAEVAEAYAAGQARSRAGIALVVARIAGTGGLRPGLEVGRATDAAYAFLHHALWTRLVDECGWSGDDFEAWCADVLAGILLEGDGAS